MPPECGHEHPEIATLTCSRDYGHVGKHGRTLKSGTFEWEQEKVKKKYNREQIVSMIEQERDKLQITLDAGGSGSREADMLRTVVPIFQNQLMLLESVLDLIKD